MPITPLQTDVGSAVSQLLGQLLSWPDVAGIALLAVALWLVYRRTEQSDDPSFRPAIQTDTGSASLLISGAYLIAAITVGAMWLMQDTLGQFPVLLALPVGIVFAAWWMEKQEAMG